MNGALACCLLLALLGPVAYGRNLQVNADDNVEAVYIDGNAINIPSSGRTLWTRATTISVPNTYQTVAVYAVNRGGRAGLMWEDTQLGITSSTQWKCSKSYEPDWFSPYFDASNWKNATLFDPDNDGYYMPFISGFSTSVPWIWHDIPIVDSQNKFKNAYCRYGGEPQPNCFCHGRDDPLTNGFDGQTVALTGSNAYVFAEINEGSCKSTSFVSTNSPPQISADKGVFIIDKFMLVTNGGQKAYFDLDNVAKYDDVTITENSYSNGGMDFVKVGDNGWNVTWCDVTVQWSVDSRVFVDAPLYADRLQSANLPDVKNRGNLDNWSRFVLIDKLNPFDSYTKLAHVRFWGRRKNGIRVGIFTKNGASSFKVKNAVQVTPVLGFNEIDLSDANLTGDKGDYVGFIYDSLSVIPFDFTSSSRWWHSNENTVPGIGDSVNGYIPNGKRFYSFDFDTEVLGTKTTITTTSVTLIAPKQNGNNYSGLCGNCDQIQNDLEKDAAGQPIQSGSAGMKAYADSYSVINTNNNPFV